MSLRSLLVTATVALVLPSAHAVTVVSGHDFGANGADPHPGSSAAAASFDAAAGSLGSLTLIDFEALAVGRFSSLEIAPGVTLTGSDRNGAGQSIRNAAQGTPDRLYGYNTTVGGRNFAYINGGSMTFAFETPVVAFGAYFSGVQFASELIQFDDGSSRTVELPFDFSTGGVSFIGLSGFDHGITGLVINTVQASNALGDLVGVDDVRVVTSVPEPGSAELLAFGLMGAFFVRRRAERETLRDLA